MSWPKSPTVDPVLHTLARLDEQVLVVCPYNKSHRMVNTNFVRHLLKCRKDYQDLVLQSGNPVLYVKCRFFHSHEVLPPELDFHEKVCQEIYMDGAGLVDLIYRNELEKFKGPWPEWKPDELDEESFKLLNSEPYPPTSVPEGVVLWADPELSKSPNKLPTRQPQPIVRASELAMKLDDPDSELRRKWHRQQLPEYHDLEPKLIGPLLLDETCNAEAKFAS